MARKSEYKVPGWERQPVTWSYSVAFKKPRGKRLLWVSTDERSVVRASKQANAFMSENHPGEDFIEYGISKTFWSHWEHYSEPITKDEYEFALEKQRASEARN